jgi:uncharacterized protein YnzC (UPF0291/DUF896 family)
VSKTWAIMQAKPEDFDKPLAALEGRDLRRLVVDFKIADINELAEKTKAIYAVTDYSLAEQKLLSTPLIDKMRVSVEALLDQIESLRARPDHDPKELSRLEKRWDGRFKLLSQLQNELTKRPDVIEIATKPPPPKEVQTKPLEDEFADVLEPEA